MKVDDDEDNGEEIYGKKAELQDLQQELQDLQREKRRDLQRKIDYKILLDEQLTQKLVMKANMLREMEKTLVEIRIGTEY